MAKFLDTSGVNNHLTQIIKDAKTRLVIISPYVSLHGRLKKLFEEKKKFPNLDIRLVYRRQEGSGNKKGWDETRKWLDSLNHVKTSFLKDLHAKCYLNENEALITSMNLYEYSQDRNYEMGILVSKDTDLELYEEVFEESQRIVKASKEVRTSTLSKAAGGISRAARGVSKLASAITEPVLTRGYCIRCGTKVPANPLEPFCPKHMEIWTRYSNSDYPEKHCHTCGNPEETGKSKPSCLPCYRKYKNVLKYPSG